MALRMLEKHKSIIHVRTKKRNPDAHVAFIDLRPTPLIKMLKMVLQYIKNEECVRLKNNQLNSKTRLYDRRRLRSVDILLTFRTIINYAH